MLTGFNRRGLRRFAFLAAIACASSAGLYATSSQAQDAVADFYKGKQIRFVIRAAPGGGFDLYSRLVGRHIVNHVPGRPTVVPQNMPGAGGITAANFMAEVAPKDGTYLTMMGQALALDQALGFTPSFKADLRTFGWIGNVSDSNVLSYTWHTSATKTMQDATRRETLMGGSGAGDSSSWLPSFFNNVLGTRSKVIDGYRSVSEVKLAMERGEVDGVGSNPVSAMLSASPNFLSAKLVNVLVQVGLRRDRLLPDVPLPMDLTDEPGKKAILEFVSKSMAIGRPIGTTPGVPVERLAALRRAFDAMLLDPLFLEDARKQGADIGPMDGKTVAQLINDVLGAPQELKDRVKQALPAR